ncbi:helix-turn-helix domain-containing protein [Alteromonas sp. 009811495]|uniref:helix-turn-helix domain-containing protein n=1 Tax=Alteromonas sp. 009811495 TaxID=3002962 RepID=UPI00237E9AE9|nr:helix-turn-helix transcriptional regulator [Alteromonas sp. 009811495]WDT87958.1 helix-turn-helix transcriptional regulator [Alteromonas sp. 009811495]
MSNEVKLNTKKILTLRTSNCWSQEELASASGLSVRTIQRVEKSGVASLETTKALSSVFGVTPLELQTVSTFENMSLGFIIKYAWLVAFALSSVFFGLWIVDILIPTLKGANFDQQYELHGNFRYLYFGGLSFFAGFLLLVFNVSWEHTSKKKLIGASRSQA